ncbi:hypothetical protein OEA41_008011 [Lepraria neglecta]|uniref:Uncharacterized protein n=1 Tax=Lepraria neglecta TaxID=209136 RepID=A0AAD9ZDR6_9LECA|nr:hypothetical protein OEA41_008011 [Lepraria neglecta]
MHVTRSKWIAAMTPPSPPSSSSDSFDSDTEHEALFATTPTCAVLPDFGSSNEGKMKNTMIGDGGTGGSIAATLNFQEHRESLWLGIDRFPNGDQGSDHNSGGAEDKC